MMMTVVTLISSAVHVIQDLVYTRLIQDLVYYASGRLLQLGLLILAPASLEQPWHCDGHLHSCHSLVLKRHHNQQMTTIKR